MKILVISILRLGDVLMAAPALEGLRRRYPKAKIDLLVNEPLTMVKALLPQVDSVIGFDRQGLQDGLVQPDWPLFEPYDRLRGIIAKLNEGQYDIVVNLTQNRLSGYLAALINAQEHIGLSLNSRGQASYGSSWFKYLNDFVGAGASRIFHYSDIFYFGLGYEKGRQQFHLSETECGKKEIEEFIRASGFKSGPRIVVQALTSDEKKNWGEEKWVEALHQLKIFEPDAQLILLGAAFEKDRLETISRRLAEKNVKADVAILSLEGAFALLNICDLLITGDTSIKHLASASPIQILELCIGSSDYRKTGAYKDNALILRSREHCNPCDHAKKCFRTEHSCAKNISAGLVALAANKFLQKDWAALKVIAEEYADEAEFLRTQFLPTGLWRAEDLLSEKTETNLSDHLDRAAWQFFLGKEHLKQLATYGTQSLKIKNQLDLNWSENEREVLKISLEQIESTIMSVESRLNKVLAELSRRLRGLNALETMDLVDDSLKDEIQNIEKELGLGRFLSEKISLHPNTGLYRVRQLQNSLNETFSHQQIKLKLLRSLKIQIMESR